MQIPSFSTIHIMTKVKNKCAKFILGIDHGWKIILTLIPVIFFGFISFFYYKVPVKDTQITIKKIYGKDYTIGCDLDIGLNYGYTDIKKYQRESMYGIGALISKVNKVENKKVKKVGFVSDSIFSTKLALKIFNDSISSHNPNFPYTINSIYGIYLRQNSPSIIFWLYEQPTVIDKRNFKYAYYDRKNNYKILDLENDYYRYIHPGKFFNTQTFEWNYTNLQYIYLIENTNQFALNIPILESFTRPSFFQSLYDISQSYFHFDLDIPTNLKNNRIEINFGSVIDISNIFPEPDIKAMDTFCYTDSAKISIIKENGLWVHTKFAQLENLQILRMFIVTTLWGFFTALMFSSLWQFLRIRSRRYRIRKNKEITSVKEVNEEE